MRQFSTTLNGWLLYSEIFPITFQLLRRTNNLLIDAFFSPTSLPLLHLLHEDFEVFVHLWK